MIFVIGLKTGSREGFRCPRFVGCLIQSDYHDVISYGSAQQLAANIFIRLTIQNSDVTVITFTEEVTLSRIGWRFLYRQNSSFG